MDIWNETHMIYLSIVGMFPVTDSLIVIYKQTLLIKEQIKKKKAYQLSEIEKLDSVSA